MNRLVRILLLFSILFTLNAKGQQTVIYPGLSGSVLRDSLAANYKTQFVFLYDTARDSLFGKVFYREGLVECQYTGDTIRIDLSDTISPRTQADAKGFNTEHSYPQSKGAMSGNANSDLFHLFPIRSDVNSSRNNLPYMDIPDSLVSRWWRHNYSQTTIPDTLKEEYSKRATNGFEVRDIRKGDIARAVFYFYTMYKSEADNADPFFFNSQIKYLRRWHNFDKPDSSEYLRNDITANLQTGIVNPFILDTTLVNRAYGIDPPATFSVSVINETQTKLKWQRNDSNDDVLIVRNQSGVFKDPVDGIMYANGLSPELNGFVITSTADSTIDFLPQMGSYYYKIYSVHNLIYSTGLFQNVTTGFTDALHYWNFNNNAPAENEIWDTLIPAFTGSGMLTHNLPDVRAYQGSLINALPNDQAGSSFSPKGMINNNNAIILHVPTTFKKDIVFSYAARGTSTGYDTHSIYYTTDGLTFDSLTSFYALNYDWVVRTVDFSSIAAVNDNPNFKIKIYIRGATHSLGNNRFDNFKILGNDLDFSIRDSLSEIQIKVYPNPFTDYLNLESLTEKSTPCKIEIFSINGTLVYSKTECLPLSISTKSLAQGIYTLLVSKKNYTERYKLIKL
ncbi:MAG: endonuclease [Bacteroidales bacterium]|nr:endonuclease [Bacteroidales bacterium]